MKRYIPFIILLLVSVNVFATADTVKIPIHRIINHDKINAEQKLLDKADGKIDGIIKATHQEDINLAITDAMLRQVNEMQDSVETNYKIKGQQQKVLYLNYIEQLVRSFREKTKQKLLDPAYAPLLVTTFYNVMLATADSTSMAPIINEAPYDVAKIVTEIFIENKGYKESKAILFHKFSFLFPEKIISNIEPFVNEPFADSLLVVGCKANPTSVYNFAQATNTATGMLIHQSKNTMVQKVVELSKTKNALFIFLF
ncbi:MAG: hypothetical protein IPP48_04700 [Chitinophagaceae bacterium]|nr:hypothetical protein [Chitinophagaceae bacterium]